MSEEQKVQKKFVVHFAQQLERTGMLVVNAADKAEAEKLAWDESDSDRVMWGKTEEMDIDVAKVVHATWLEFPEVPRAYTHDYTSYPFSVLDEEAHRVSLEATVQGAVALGAYNDYMDSQPLKKYCVKVRHTTTNELLDVKVVEAATSSEAAGYAAKTVRRDTSVEVERVRGMEG